MSAMRKLQMTGLGVLMAWSGGAAALTDDQQACVIEAAQAAAGRYPAAKLGDAVAEVEAKAIAGTKFVNSLTSPAAFASAVAGRLGLFTATEVERIKDAQARGAPDESRMLLGEKLISAASSATLVRVPLSIAGQSAQAAYTCLMVRERALIAPAR